MFPAAERQLACGDVKSLCIIKVLSAKISLTILLPDEVTLKLKLEPHHGVKHTNADESALYTIKHIHTHLYIHMSVFQILNLIWLELLERLNLVQPREDLDYACFSLSEWTTQFFYKWLFKQFKSAKIGCAPPPLLSL